MLKVTVAVSDEIEAIETMRFSTMLENMHPFLMYMSKIYGPISVVYKTEMPYLMIFVGEGKDGKVGFGSSINEALMNAIQRN